MLYVGLDISSARVALCIIDEDGGVVRQTVVASEPAVIADTLAPHQNAIESVGLEAGPTSNWLARELRDLGCPVVVIDDGHAAAALRTGRNKTDHDDARGIADLMRVEKFRPGWVKSPQAQRDRGVLAVREQLRQQSLDLQNAVWSILQAEGLNPPKLAKAEFRNFVDAALEDPALEPVLGPLVRLIDHLDREVSALDLPQQPRPTRSAGS